MGQATPGVGRTMPRLSPALPRRRRSPPGSSPSPSRSSLLADAPGPSRAATCCAGRAAPSSRRWRPSWAPSRPAGPGARRRASWLLLLPLAIPAPRPARPAAAGPLASALRDASVWLAVAAPGARARGGCGGTRPTSAARGSRSFGPERSPASGRLLDALVRRDRGRRAVRPARHRRPRAGAPFSAAALLLPRPTRRLRLAACLAHRRWVSSPR